MEQLFFFNHQVILYYIYIYIYINFLPFLCGFSPRCLERWRQGVWSCGLRRAGCPGKAVSKSRLQEMRWNSGVPVPKQRHFFPPQGPTLTSKHRFPHHSPGEKGSPAKAQVHLPPGLPFLLTNYVHGKNACFSKPKNKRTKIKTKTHNKPSAWKFLWMKCPKVRGTLPAQSLL